MLKKKWDNFTLSLHLQLWKLFSLTQMWKLLSFMYFHKVQIRHRYYKSLRTTKDLLRDFLKSHLDKDKELKLRNWLNEQRKMANGLCLWTVIWLKVGWHPLKSLFNSLPKKRMIFIQTFDCFWPQCLQSTSLYQFFKMVLNSQLSLLEEWKQIWNDLMQNSMKHSLRLVRSQNHSKSLYLDLHFSML